MKTQGYMDTCVWIHGYGHMDVSMVICTMCSSRNPNPKIAHYYVMMLLLLDIYILIGANPAAARLA